MPSLSAGKLVLDYEQSQRLVELMESEAATIEAVDKGESLRTLAAAEDVRKFADCGGIYMNVRDLRRCKYAVNASLGAHELERAHGASYDPNMHEYDQRLLRAVEAALMECA